MDMEVSVETLSEAFGFVVSEGFLKAIKAAHARSPEEPHKGLNKFGLELGGPLYGFMGGSSAQSLRCPQMPPEFFPFAVRRSRPNERGASSAGQRLVRRCLAPPECFAKKEASRL